MYSARNLLTFVFALFLYEPLAAQLLATSGQGVLTDGMGRVVTSRKASTIEGTPYLSDYWQKGAVLTNNNKLYGIEKMKFNAFKSEVEYQFNENIYLLTDEIKAFQIDLKQEDGKIKTKTFKKGFKIIDQNSVNTFYEVLFDGNTKFLRKYHVSRKTYTEPLTTIPKEEYFQSKAFYICRPDGEMVRVKEKKKSVLEALPDTNDDLRKFILEHQLETNSNENIANLLEIYLKP